jgi:hypothetical protein
LASSEPERRVVGLLVGGLPADRADARVATTSTRRAAGFSAVTSGIGHSATKSSAPSLGQSSPPRRSPNPRKSPRTRNRRTDHPGPRRTTTDRDGPRQTRQPRRRQGCRAGERGPSSVGSVVVHAGVRARSSDSKFDRRDLKQQLPFQSSHQRNSPSLSGTHT